MTPDVFRRWREAGAVAAVRVNPLASGGIGDLAAVMRGEPIADRTERLLRRAKELGAIEEGG